MFIRMPCVNATIRNISVVSDFDRFVIYGGKNFPELKNHFYIHDSTITSMS